MRGLVLGLLVLCGTWTAWTAASAWHDRQWGLTEAHAAQPMQAQDVLEVDGSHIRRVYDPTYGVACYLVRWPAANAPDLACVKVSP